MTFRKTLISGILAAVSGFGLVAPAHAEWLEVKSPHFTVYGNMAEGDLRERTLRLEKFDALLRTIFSAPDREPVSMYFVSGPSDVQGLMGDNSGMVQGFYNASAQRAYAVMPVTFTRYIKDFTPQTVLFHEYTHHMLLTNIDQFMPGWAQEGLAEMFATAKLEKDGGVSFGYKNDSRGEAMLGMQRWTVQRMLDSDVHPPKDREESIEKYSRGWALCHYLWLSGKRPGQYAKFLAELNKGGDPVGVGERVFGDLGKLNKELDSYILQHNFKFSTFSAEQLKAPTSVTVRKLSAGEAAIMPFRIRSSVGVSQRTALPLAVKARPVAGQYPNDVGVQETMAEIEHDAKDYAASNAAADRALAVQPSNVFALAYKGRVAARNAVASGKPEDWKEARRWIIKANRANPEHALPLMLYYDSFIAANETPNDAAVNGLFKSMTLVPQDDGLRIRAALELIRLDDIAKARSVIAPAAFQAEGVGESPSLKLVVEIDKGAKKEALLAKIKELKLDKINDFIDPPKKEPKDGKDGGKDGKDGKNGGGAS